MKKINKKLLWLDLELRKDIDDYIALLSAINHSYSRIKYISIHNPSQLELNLSSLTKENSHFKNNLLF